MNWRFYIILGGIIAVSFAAAVLLPVPETFRGIAALPAVGALGTFLLQAIYLGMEHRLQMRLDRERNAFAVAITSHMADVLFDKHVEFSEAYIQAVYRVLDQLYRDGPTKDALELSAKVSDVRRQFAPWLTFDIEQQLSAFEDALARIGAGSGYADTLPVGPQRTAAFSDVFAAFQSVISHGKGGTGTPLPPEAARSVVEHVRQILGIQNLLRLRVDAVAKAATHSETSGAVDAI